MNSQEMFIEVT